VVRQVDVSDTDGRRRQVITSDDDIFATRAYFDNQKKLLNSNISTCPHNIVNVSQLTTEIVWRVWGTPGNLNGFSILPSLVVTAPTVAQQRSTKLCTMFGRLLAGTLYIHFWGLLSPNGILPRAKFTLRPKSCVLLLWQHYCTALEQWASAKHCGVVQGMELRNFRRGRQLYSAGQPSR